MTRSPVIALLSAVLLLQGCIHPRGSRQGTASPFAMEDDPAAESSTEGMAAPTAPPACSIAPSVFGGMAKGLLVPLLLCLAGGPICGIVVEEAAGVAAGLIAGSATIGGLVGAIEGASRCRPYRTPAVPVVPDDPAPSAAPEPAPPPAAMPPASAPSALEPCPIGPPEPAPAPGAR